MGKDNLRFDSDRELWIVDTSTWIKWGRKAKGKYIAEAIPNNVILLIPGSVLKELDTLQRKEEYVKPVSNAIKAIKELKYKGNIVYIKGLPTYKDVDSTAKKKELIKTYDYFKNKGTNIFLVTDDENLCSLPGVLTKKIDLKLNSIRFLYEGLHYLRVGLILLFLFLAIKCFFSGNPWWGGISLIMSVSLISLPEIVKPKEENNSSVEKKEDSLTALDLVFGIFPWETNKLFSFDNLFIFGIGLTDDLDSDED